MDPSQTYHDMMAALQEGDQDAARELALALQNWFACGGFCPPQQSREAIDAAVANVLAQTAAAVVVPFSLICQHCDAGMEMSSEAEATAAGWTGIEYAPELPTANYLGTCPNCKADEQ